MKRALCFCLLWWGSVAAAQEPSAQYAPLPPQPVPAPTLAPPPPPPPVQEAPPAPAPEAPPASDSHSGFSARLSLGGTYRNLYGIHFGGGDATVLLGGQTKKHVGFYADIEGFLGTTKFGLTTSNFQLGFITEGEIGRLRIGGGVLFGWLIVRRITTDGTMFDFTVGPSLQGSFDIVRFEGHGFFVFAKGGLDWLVFATNSRNTGTPVMARVSAGLGIRY
jgi:hypothetical protein